MLLKVLELIVRNWTWVLDESPFFYPPLSNYFKDKEEKHWKKVYHDDVLEELSIYQKYDMQNEVLYERLERERQNNNIL